MSREDPYRAHIRAPEIAAPPSVTICRSCGIVAPEQGTACEGCKRPLPEVRVQVAPPAADLTWVAVKCGFTCNQCKFLAPLDGLDADGAVDCAHCGLRQRFDVAAWKTALEFAHAVGDLAGPAPEGKYPHPSVWVGDENDYAKVGLTHTFVVPTGAELSVDIRVSPGHPVCKKCRVPLSTSVLGVGALATRCPTCSDEARYALADGARNLYDRLVGAVADEHRADRPRAQATATQAGVLAVKCPGCGAPLQLQGTDKVQTCSYCKATCFVAGKQMARFNHQTPEPEVWWLLFRGVSTEREKLLAAVPEEKAAGGNVIAILKPGAKTDTIGDKPGVYEAPEKPGTDWPQVALTLVLGTLALVMGYLILGK